MYSVKELLALGLATLPGTERGIVNTVKSLEQFSGAVAGSKDSIADTVVKFHAASESLARAGDSVDRFIVNSRDPLSRTFSNAEIASANLKALTRQVRWQPWILLKKPSKAAELERGVYNAALDFSEGADSLNNSVKELVALMNASNAKTGGLGADTEKFNALIQQVHGNLEKSVALERKLWKDLMEKGAKAE